MKRGIWLLLLVGCSTELPQVDPARLACEDDSVLAGGALQCPADSTCVDALCRPRLDCRDPDRVDCTPDVTVCEPIVREQTVAVRCTSGVLTASVATVPRSEGQRCPDLTYEVAFATGPAIGRYPLFVVGAEALSAANGLGVTGEVPAWRRCAPVCSSEANCPGDHTCRAAAFVGPGLLADPTESRYTIGVCYPNRLVATRTSSVQEEAPEPRSNACRQAVDCLRGGRSGQCRYDVEKVADHPTVPAASAWGDRYALYAQCTNQDPTSLLEEGIGCERGEVCKSGICLGRCARPCDPARPAQGCGSRPCVERIAERQLANGQAIQDSVFVCAAN